MGAPRALTAMRLVVLTANAYMLLASDRRGLDR